MSTATGPDRTALMRLAHRLRNDATGSTPGDAGWMQCVADTLDELAGTPRRDPEPESIPTRLAMIAGYAARDAETARTSREQLLWADVATTFTQLATILAAEQAA